MKTFEERKASILQKARSKRRNRSILTACVAGVSVMALALVLFLPYPTSSDLRMYQDSDYYAVIQKLDSLSYQNRTYKNNFQSLMSILSIPSKDRNEAPGMVPNNPGLNASPSAPTDDMANGSNYQEVTDNQVAGVIEADIFKRSDQYIYHLMGNVLDIYPIAAEESAIISRTNFTEKMQDFLPNADTENSITSSYFSPMEMYLSQDCKTVTIIGAAGYNYKATDRDYLYYEGVALVNVDVSDPENVSIREKQLFIGRYTSSRMVDGQILLAYQHQNYQNTIDFHDESSFIPQYGWFDDLRSIPAEDILLPAQADNACYTVVAKLSGDDLQLQGMKALLSYAQEIYVSQDSIFLTHCYGQRLDQKLDGSYTRKTMTEITGIDFSGEALSVLGSITVAGGVKDQYSMDAHEGILRVVTSTSERKIQTHESPPVLWTDGDSASNVNLYCIDLATWQIAGKVEGFAPPGEEATSVRFDGTNAYVCTAEVIKLTDPVYFFDLKDPANITYTDTGTIGGYSTSLIQFGNGNLLGIGINDKRACKIEVYRQGEDSVDSVCSYEREANYSGVYKSYFIDREKQLIGLGVQDWEDDKTHYILLQFDGESLKVVEDVVFEYAWDLQMFRADIIDNYLYVLYTQLKVEKLDI